MERGRVVTIGGSVGALGAAIGLARQGWHVTVVERDVDCPTDNGDEAFLAWERRSVPQFRQPHAFSARSRNLLLRHAPEVVERLRADGIEEINLFKLLAPEELWSADDDIFAMLWTRRPAFELALRRTAAVTPGVEILSPAVVSGLTFASNGPGPPRATGIQLEGGGRLDADVILDCGGRRSPVPRWLAERGVIVPEDVQDCDIAYYTRYYRRRPESELPLIFLIGSVGEMPGLMYIGFTGDHDTFGWCLGPAPDDAEFRVLRHNWAFDAAANHIPAVAPWVAATNADPINDVQVMASHENVRRHFVVDGEPLVLGVLPVGDSLCATNPTYGWGASMALTYAFAAVEAITEHGDDVKKLALAYDEAVRDEADAVYHESAAMDRARIYRWRGQDVPDWDRDEVERQSLIRDGVGAGALRDPVLGRAQLRRMNLLESPRAVLDDPEVRERATAMRERLAGKPPRQPPPTREGLLAAIAAARPASA